MFRKRILLNQWLFGYVYHHFFSPTAWCKATTPTKVGLTQQPKVTGDANDYVGKGMNGGRVVAVAPAESSFKSEVR